MPCFPYGQTLGKTRPAMSRNSQIDILLFQQVAVAASALLFQCGRCATLGEGK